MKAGSVTKFEEHGTEIIDKIDSFLWPKLDSPVHSLPDSTTTYKLTGRKKDVSSKKNENGLRF